MKDIVKHLVHVSVLGEREVKCLYQEIGTFVKRRFLGKFEFQEKVMLHFSWASVLKEGSPSGSEFPSIFLCDVEFVLSMRSSGPLCPSLSCFYCS